MQGRATGRLPCGGTSRYSHHCYYVRQSDLPAPPAQPILDTLTTHYGDRITSHNQ